jgi:hypothetical protein
MQVWPQRADPLAGCHGAVSAAEPLRDGGNLVARSERLLTRQRTFGLDGRWGQTSPVSTRIKRNPAGAWRVDVTMRRTVFPVAPRLTCHYRVTV